MCCLCVLLFSGMGPIIPEKTAARVAAHPALAEKEVVRFPLAPMDRWGLPSIPLNTGRDLPSIRPSTGGGAHCYRCVVPVCPFGGGRGEEGGGGGRGGLASPGQPTHPPCIRTNFLRRKLSINQFRVFADTLGRQLATCITIPVCVHPPPLSMVCESHKLAVCSPLFRHMVFAHRCQPASDRVSLVQKKCAEKCAEEAAKVLHDQWHTGSKLVCGDKIHREMQLDTLLLRFGHNLWNNFGPLLVIQRGTNAHS